MAKKYRIKDIAALAGVSAGTVDRVIHKRGDVSFEAQEKVEKVLGEINHPNSYSGIFPSTIKQIRILFILPQHGGEDYWGLVEKGIVDAISMFGGLKLKIRYLYYDQFNVSSCRETYNEALTLKSDMVIIGPSFYDETVLLANQLFMRDVPYVFVDTSVTDTKPLSFFGPHSFQTGIVQAKLLKAILEPGTDIAFFQAKRIGDETSIQTLARSYGFMSYLKDHFPEVNVYRAHYDTVDEKQRWLSFDEFFSKHTNIGGAVVFNTRAYLVSEYLKARNMRRIKLIGYGTDKRNIVDLKDEYISFIISERPYYQGYLTTKTMIEYLVYNKTVSAENFTPIDILIKETIDFYTF